MVLIDTNLKAAIRKVMEEGDLSQANLSDDTGIHQSSLCRMLSGEHKSMSDDNFFKLLPYIKKYLPENYIPKDIRGREKMFRKSYHQTYLNVKNVNNKFLGPENKDVEDPLLLAMVKYFSKLSESKKAKIIAQCIEMLEPTTK